MAGSPQAQVTFQYFRAHQPGEDGKHLDTVLAGLGSQALGQM
jgi:hypothetical protein